MKNAALVRVPGEHICYWREISNSLPVGTTVTEFLPGGPLLNFVVQHIHVDLPSNTRVMCMVPVDGQGNVKTAAEVKSRLLVSGTNKCWHEENYAGAGSISRSQPEGAVGIAYRSWERARPEIGNAGA